MYVLGESPSTPNDGFDALENVLGSREFTMSEATEVLTEVLGITQSEAQSEFNSLLRSDAIVEV